MKDRPQMELVGHDGNIFAVMGSAARLLRRADMREEAEEMVERVTSSSSYYEALNIVSEYVQTELSGPDTGILEADDIVIDTEFIYDHDGITAYIETWFDTAKKFNVDITGDDSIDLYATVQPDTGEFKTGIIIKWETNGEHEYRDVTLLPCERTLILSEMEKVSQEQTHQSLKEQFAEWKLEYGGDQIKSPKKEKKNHQHER